ncbi:MAG: hypothetical protein HON68_01375 [Gammaproteobacteria bacterium]|jgi:PBP1b-binding outer membrane lipoprotein LpoB|nr:hypothetical protein [Gammaproteobacteria bacterium]MBT3719365.1 hypothetical protein [Gammaproteobacteria bacterium]MBT3845351.1 hypothetical protein [Gammaproteobacteria bacterium]MBT4300677.1 hypothetical protein [Gammaproteobacteria bacterium]MBT4787765.1 hypothetical protein [Gammaproteobacteria bacterium]
MIIENKILSIVLVLTVAMFSSGCSNIKSISNKAVPTEEVESIECTYCEIPSNIENTKGVSIIQDIDACHICGNTPVTVRSYSISKQEDK